MRLCVIWARLGERESRLLLDLSIPVDENQQRCSDKPSFRAITAGGTFLPADVALWLAHHTLMRADHLVTHGYKAWGGGVSCLPTPPLHRYGSRTVSAPLIEHPLGSV